MSLNVSQVSHIDAVRVEHAGESLGIGEVVAAGFRLEGEGKAGDGFLFEVGGDSFELRFLEWGLFVGEELDGCVDVGVDG